MTIGYQGINADQLSAQYYLSLLCQYRIELSEVKIGSSEIKTDNSTGVTVHASNITIKGTAHWHWRLDFWYESPIIKNLKLHNYYFL